MASDSARGGRPERLVNLLRQGVVNLGVRCHFEAPVAASPLFRGRQELSPYALSSVTFRYGFLEAGLRSHADGCDPSRPVGFVEGWFVTIAAPSARALSFSFATSRGRGFMPRVAIINEGKLVLEDSMEKLRGSAEMLEDAFVRAAGMERTVETLDWL